jgi:hypothetical protein
VEVVQKQNMLRNGVPGKQCLAKSVQMEGHVDHQINTWHHCCTKRLIHKACDGMDARHRYAAAAGPRRW